MLRARAIVALALAGTACGSSTQTIDLGQGLPLGTCGTDAPTVTTFASSAALSALLVGKWERCAAYADAGADHFGQDFVGMELASDDSLYTLALDAGGQLVRSTADATWTWTILADAIDGAGTYQINLTQPAGSDIAFATFSPSGRHMSLDVEGETIELARLQ